MPITTDHIVGLPATAHQNPVVFRVILRNRKSQARLHDEGCLFQSRPYEISVFGSCFELEAVLLIGFIQRSVQKMAIMSRARDEMPVREEYIKIGKTVG